MQDGYHGGIASSILVLDGFELEREKKESGGVKGERVLI